MFGDYFNRLRLFIFKLQQNKNIGFVDNFFFFLKISVIVSPN